MNMNVPRSVGFGIAFLLVLSCSGVRAHQGASLRVDEILDKTSAAYKGAEHYKLVAEKNITVEAVGEQHDLGGTRTYSNFHQSTDTQITVVAVGADKARVTLKDESREIVVVKNGSAVWTYVPTKKEYSDKATKDYIREEQIFLVKRFQYLSGYASVALLEKEEPIKVGGNKVNCYVLKIPTEHGSHELWIDEEKFIVWRSKDVSPTPQNGISLQTTVTFNLKEADLNANLEDSLFTFSPPEKAKKVDVITQ